MKSIFLSVAIVLSLTASAQVTKVTLQASGLTCSMCSNAINKALKTLDFVDKIEANVGTYSFEISFKENRQVDFGQIKRKVEDAGFAVSTFVAAIRFSNVWIKNNQPVPIDNMSFLFVDSPDQLVDGIKEIKLLDKGFVSSKESRKNNIPVSSLGIYHASIK